MDYLSATRPTGDQPVLIMAPFLSPRTQERLKASGFGYADLTGNVRLSLPKAGLFLETTGARENPAPTVRDRKSLKGAKAGRLIRALADYRPPVGLRELAKRAGVDPGYTSRVIDVLNRDALVVRTARGPITGYRLAGALATVVARVLAVSTQGRDVVPCAARSWAGRRQAQDSLLPVRGQRIVGRHAVRLGRTGTAPLVLRR